jgi:hypothetical protein
MGARDLDPILSIEYTTDPMWYKFPSLSPYNAMGNNPIMFIDPDGKEKINAFQKEDKLHTAAEKAKDNDNTIYVFAHGNSGAMHLSTNSSSNSNSGWQLYPTKTSINTQKETSREIFSAAELDKFLSVHSTLWQNRSENDNFLIVLVSCNVGYLDLAKQISENPIFKNHTIIAPDNFVWGDKNGIFTVSPKATNSDGSIIYRGGTPIRSDELGKWNYYNNGKLVQTKEGDDFNNIVIPYRATTTE